MGGVLRSCGGAATLGRERRRRRSEARGAEVRYSTLARVCVSRDAGQGPKKRCWIGRYDRGVEVLISKIGNGCVN